MSSQCRLNDAMMEYVGNMSERVCWRCWRLRAKKSMREVIVKIPKRMLNENEHTVVHQEPERGDFVYISTKRYETDYEPDTIQRSDDERLCRNVAN